MPVRVTVYDFKSRDAIAVIRQIVDYISFGPNNPDDDWGVKGGVRELRELAHAIPVRLEDRGIDEVTARHLLFLFCRSCVHSDFGVEWYIPALGRNEHYWVAKPELAEKVLERLSRELGEQGEPEGILEQQMEKARGLSWEFLDDDA